MPSAPILLSLAMVVGVFGGCVTARGLADDGHLLRACLALSQAPSPLIDDDAPALASRVRQKIPGDVTTRLLDPRTVASSPELLLTAPTLVEVVVDAAGFDALGPVTLVDAVGTRVPATPLHARTVLAMFGAPDPPAPIVTTSTHTPGPIETAIKAIGMVTVGVPLAIMTLGLIPPDLGGLFSTGPSTSTWSTDSPELGAWRSRPDVVAAVELGTTLGLSAPVCFGGRCRLVVAVQNADAFARVSVPVTIGLEGCALSDVLEVPLSSSSKPTSTPLSAVPGDTGQWSRFQATGFGLWPLLDDVGDAAGDCCAWPFDLLDDCTRC